MVKPWRTLQTDQLLETDILTVQKSHRKSPASGVTGEFITINAPDWVNVIAVTASRDVLLIRQYRHGTDNITLEIPGGIIDRDESPEKAAARELLEETGYAGDSPVRLGVTDVNPAIQTNQCYTFLIQNAEQIEEPNLGKYEEIEMQSTPVAEIPELISRRIITHSLVITAFYWYNQRRPTPDP
ncbi:MAG: ADP-ribose pyrophosphatase [Candidatus Marinimicrobia bacterium]|nr:ADP-ribose pyrophosphatase [Candidatus Neomarinimicrobiota bacterium]